MMVLAENHQEKEKRVIEDNDVVNAKLAEYHNLELWKQRMQEEKDYAAEMSQ